VKFREEGKNSEDKTDNTFEKEMEKIKIEIKKDIDECNVKQSKDIIILIDFNLYDSEYNNVDDIMAFIDHTKTILNSYLSNNDRLGVFIYTKQYQIICPLMCKIQIDINNFSNDLIYYKKKVFNEFNETDDFYFNENVTQREKFEIQSNDDNMSVPEDDDSFDRYDNDFDNEKIIPGLLKTISYIRNYFKMKEVVKNEKYIILFTDLFNSKIIDRDIKKKFEAMPKDREIHFLLVGKKMGRDTKKEKEDSQDDNDEEKLMMDIIEKFGDRSELIDFENMKKIKTILSSNNVIKDEIIYPNEIYK